MIDHEPLILVVEDDQDHLELIKRNLEKGSQHLPEGLQLETAASIKDATKFLTRNTPDLIVADWVLPDGCAEVLLSNEPAESGIPIIIMTSHGNEQIAVDAIKLGALDYFVKSESTFADLPHIVARSLREWQQRQEFYKTQLALVISDSRYHQLFMSAPIGIIIVNLEGEILNINPELLSLLGSPSEEKSKELNIFKFPHLKKSGIADSFRRCVENATSVITEHDYTSIWGKRNHFQLYITPMRDFQDKLIGAQAFVIDMSALKEYQSALEKSEQLYQALFDDAPDCIILEDDSGMILDVNHAAERLTGYSSDQLIGLNTSVLGLSRTKAVKNEKAIEPDQVQSEEGIILRQDGTTVPVEITVTSFPLNSSGRHYLSIVRDVSLRKMREVDLMELEKKYRTIFQVSPIGIAIADHNGKILEANPAAAYIFGISIETLYSKPLTDPSWRFIYLDDRPVEPKDLPFTIAVQEMRRVEDVQIGFKDESGHVTWISIYCDPVEDEKYGVVIAYVDITKRIVAEKERRKLEANVQRAQRLDSLGVLAGGLAHDFNNMLEAIVGNAELVLMNLGKDHEMVSNLETIRTISEKAAELTQQMLAYSGKGRYDVRLQDLSKEIEHILDLIKPSIPKSVKLKVNTMENLPPILADSIHLQQVLINLLTNAWESLKDHYGTIEINTGIKDVDQYFLDISAAVDDARPGKYVFLEVKDDGCGMSSEVRERMFEPFFTSKFTGRGLGLSAVLGIVRSHKGAIQVVSSKGAGTSITVLFPAQFSTVKKKEIPESTSKREGTEKIKDTLTILIADDEPEVLNILEELLLIVGNKVLTATDGQEAVDRFREYAEEIDMILLDYKMPVKNGLEALREIRAISPSVPVYLASGYSQEEATRSFEGLDLAGFFQKPFRMEELLEKVDEVKTHL